MYVDTRVIRVWYSKCFYLPTVRDRCFLENKLQNVSENGMGEWEIPFLLKKTKLILYIQNTESDRIQGEGSMSTCVLFALKKQLLQLE